MNEYKRFRFTTITLIVFYKNDVYKKDTHDWCNDKPYEWGLDTLTGKTFLTPLYILSPGLRGREMCF